MTITSLPPLSTRRERVAWYLYDFGNSAYASVVYLAVFAAYFKQVVVGGAEGSRLWGLAIGIALVIVAVIAPILGALADYSGAKKRFLLGFTVQAIIFTAMLFFVQAGDVVSGMLFFILAEIGYRCSQIFYDGFLPELARPDEMGKISGTGWAIGSAGGVIALLIILPLVILIPGDTTVRFAMLITALFWVLSTIPLILWLPEKAQKKTLPPGENYVSVAFKQVAHTIRTAGHFREMTKFMIAFLVYGGGVIILLLFGLMMTNAADDPIVTDGSQKPFAFIVAAIMGGLFTAVMLDATWGDPTATVVPFADFGARIFRDFSVPVIIVAVLLDIALTGAFINARRAEEAPLNREEAAS